MRTLPIGDLDEHHLRPHSQLMEPSTSKIALTEAQMSEQQAALDQTLALLKKKDDTSKFVGLSLMRSLLDTHENLRNDSTVLCKFWDALSGAWLLSLLRAKATGKRSEAEATSLHEIAIAVLQMFASLLPPEALDTKDAPKLACGLAEVLPKVSTDTKTLAMQALTDLARRPVVGTALLSLSDKERINFLHACSDHEAGTHALRAALVSSRAAGWPSWNDEFGTLIRGNYGMNGSLKDLKVLQTIQNVLDNIQFDGTESWIDDVVDCISTIMSRPNHTLLRLSTRIFQKIIWKRPNFDPFFPAAQKIKSSSRPFSYTFITLLIINIRSTIPSLLEILASERYAEVALQLAADYDVMTAFISSLIRTLGNSNGEHQAPPAKRKVLDIPPDLLLKLRKDIAETVSLTIEFFRDRWDASVSGAAGLDRAARVAPTISLSGAQGRLSLTWDNPMIEPAGDPILIAGLRAIGIWLREDDNDQLRSEASGILDVLLSLYQESDGPQGAVLVATEGIVAAEDGVEVFLQHDGMSILIESLLELLKDQAARSTNFEHMLGIVRVLLPVTESSQVPQSKEQWLYLIPALERLADRIHPEDKQDIELFSALGHLVGALMTKAPRKFRAGYQKNMMALAQSAEDFQNGSQVLDKESLAGLREAREGFLTAL